jgi:uncharacterized membrane protein
MLRLANYLLVVMGWVEALYAYPRLPGQMPFWLNFFGHEIPRTDKSLLFFIYPLAQSLCVLGGMLFFRMRRAPKPAAESVPSPAAAQTEARIRSLKTEHVLLALIFVNLIFIHLQTSLILLAHRIGTGVNKVYFVSLFAVILILIPYYRIREKMILQRRP